jgi:multidrug efflux pump subunit AcrB
VIVDTLYDACGQRQVSYYFTQLNTSPVILEILLQLQTELSSLDRLYVKSPVTGGIVPLSAVVDIDSTKTGPLTDDHNLTPGVALGQAVDAISQARAKSACRGRSSELFRVMRRYSKARCQRCRC